LFPEWPGVLSGLVKITGTQQPLAIDVDLNPLDGNIRGQEFAAEGGMSFSRGAVSFRNFGVTHGASKIALHGDLYAATGVDYSLQLQDLGVYEKSATGTLQASGRVSLHAAHPQIRSNLTAEKISFGNIEMSSLMIEDNSVDGTEFINMKISASEMLVNGNDIDKLTVIATGDADQHDVTVELQSEHVAAALHASGALNDWQGEGAFTWRGLLEELQVEIPGDNAFELDAAAAFVVSGASASLEHRCLQSGSYASICLGGEWARGQKLDASARLQRFPVSALLLPANLEFDFSQELSGQFAMSSSGNVATKIDADIDISPGRISSTYDPDLLIETGAGRFRFRVTQDRLEAGELDIPLPGYGAIDIDFGVSEVALGLGSRLSGSVVIEVNDIAVLARMLPFLDGDAGRLTTDIVISGTPSRPLANGSFSLHDAKLYYQPLGTTLSNVQVDARISDNNQLHLTSSFQAGDGNGTITTSAAYETGQTPALEFSIAGKNLLLIDTAELRVQVEPDLQISVSDNELQIGGSIKVPHARVTPDTIPVRTESESEDVVIVAGELPGDDRAARNDSRIKVKGSLQVLLGDDVTIDLDVAKARLGGSVDFQWQDELIPIANGNYKIDGTIAALGQVLTISDGNIRFPEVPANNPYLNIRAERDIYGNSQVKTAGILVTGTARNPVVEAYTYPLTTEERALTLLVTGSDFDYEQGVGALDFGTYVSPRLFLSYGVGLFEQENIFSARFDLKKGFGIRATSGRRDSGVDINYRVDK
jgi:translocation and assembly module TamB